MIPILYALAIMAVLGIVFGIILSIADKKFAAVVVDEKVEKIRKAVAGANCGACGYPGCDGFSAAVARGEAPIDGCTPGGKKTLDLIAEIMGMKAEESEPKVARLLCQGKTGVANIRYEYTGFASCQAASQFSGGPKLCQYSCLGLGDCVKVCKFGAMSIKDGLVHIDEEKCTLCKACADICRYSAITVVGKKTLVFPELCHSCGGCQLVCKTGAVKEGSRPLGMVNFGRVRSRTEEHDISLYSGKMRVGEAMTPPLIKEVRKHEKEAECTIIDAPPGTSCPVITAMRGTNFVLMVTEPTPFGLHDLRLAVEAVKTLGIPTGLVINRAGLGDDGVKEYAEQEGLDILLEIPFSREFAEAYSKGETIVAVSPEWREKFQGLYREIEEIVAGRAK